MLKKNVSEKVIKKSLERLNKNARCSYRVCLLCKKTFSRKSPFAVVEPAAEDAVFMYTFVLFMWDQEGVIKNHQDPTIDRMTDSHPL